MIVFLRAPEQLVVLEIKRVLRTRATLMIIENRAHIPPQPRAAEPRHTPPHKIPPANLDPLVHHQPARDLQAALGVLRGGAAVDLAEERLEAVEAVAAQAGQVDTAHEALEGLRRHLLAERLPAVGKHPDPLAAHLRGQHLPQALEDVETHVHVSILFGLHVNKAQQLETRPPQPCVLRKLRLARRRRQPLKHAHLLHEQPHDIIVPTHALNKRRPSLPQHRHLPLLGPVQLRRVLVRVGRVPLLRGGYAVAPQVREEELQEELARNRRRAHTTLNSLGWSPRRRCRRLEILHLGDAERDDLLHVSRHVGARPRTLHRGPRLEAHGEGVEKVLEVVREARAHEGLEEEREGALGERGEGAPHVGGEEEHGRRLGGRNLVPVPLLQQRQRQLIRPLHAVNQPAQHLIHNVRRHVNAVLQHI
mmetsp:Transcript_38964/g.95869  ORF Transcript_38964/g.95869 Transcript_38964/m.95869 type:complete len:420 (+) Transcript_38964:234-1493(+)